MSQLKTSRQLSLKPDIENIQATTPLRPLTDALDRIFPTAAEGSRTQKARNIMGELVSGLSDEELEVYLTEFQYLIDEWLDEFERLAYEGKTLRQTLAQE